MPVSSLQDSQVALSAPGKGKRQNAPNMEASRLTELAHVDHKGTQLHL
jgi:hypothetical protein